LRGAESGQKVARLCLMFLKVELARVAGKRVGPAVDDEADMLEFSDNCQPTSRLGCQIDLTEALDGLVVQVAGEDM